MNKIWYIDFRDNNISSVDSQISNSTSLGALYLNNNPLL